MLKYKIRDKVELKSKPSLLNKFKKPKLIDYEELKEHINIKKVNLSQHDFSQFSKKHGNFNYTQAIRLFLVDHVIRNLKYSRVIEIGGAHGAFVSILNSNAEYITFDNSDFSLLPSNSIIKDDFINYLNADFDANLLYLGHTFEHLSSNRDIELIDFYNLNFNKDSIAIIEPLFIGKEYLEFSRKYERFDHKADLATIDNNFCGSIKHGMGFARIYSPESFNERILLRIKELDLHYTVLEFELDNTPLPDFSKFQHKDMHINSFLRVMLVSKSKELIEPYFPENTPAAL